MRITINISPKEEKRVLAAFGALVGVDSPKPADLKAFLVKKLKRIVLNGEREIAEAKLRDEAADVDIT